MIIPLLPLLETITKFELAKILINLDLSKMIEPGKTIFVIDDRVVDPTYPKEDQNHYCLCYWVEKGEFVSWYYHGTLYNFNWGHYSINFIEAAHDYITRFTEAVQNARPSLTDEERAEMCKRYNYKS